MKRSHAELRSPYFNKKLPREFYNQPSTDLGKALLGKVLARKLPDGKVLRGVIVETEAYPGEHDPASHSYGGKKTARTEAMFMDPGTTYVYFTYGMYYCINISSSELGGACLLRAVEPVENYAIMHSLREGRLKKKKVETSEAPMNKKRKPWNQYELCSGPGKLCVAFDVVRDTFNKLDLCTSDVMWLENSDDDQFAEGNFTIEVAKRVGIDSQPEEARNQLWRFFIKDNLAVSTAKPNQIIKRLASEGKHEYVNNFSVGQT